MKSKNLFMVSLMGIFLIGAAAVAPAQADSRSHHRLEGFVLGFGTAVIGNMLLNDPRVQVHVHGPGYGRDPHWKDHHGRGYDDRDHRHGHWEWRRVWVPPVYKKVWKPGRRHPSGRNIPGCWDEVPVSEGYWKNERVLVSSR